MTFAPVSQANSKTAEFARLFDLFDRIATRRTRALTGDASEVISADDIVSVPAEFVPVLKNLSTILSSRAIRNEEHVRRVQVASTTHPPGDTHDGAPSVTQSQMPHGVDATEPSDDDVDEEGADGPTFPLGERYPFTFKLMLHKLYDLDEWAEKVKSAVEMSKSQFKPLAERVQSVVRDATASVHQGRGDQPDLGVSAMFKPPSTTRHVQSTATSSRDTTTTGTKERGEKKSNVRPVLGASAKFKPPSTARHSHTVSMPSKPDASRVLKKRCIGRRKSVSGPMSAGVWVYDAAIAATEVAGPRRAVEITLSSPKEAGGAVKHRVRHQSLTALEEMQARADAARPKIKITVPLLQEEVDESPQPWSFTEPVQQVVATESALKKRTSMASIFAGSCKRVAVKRPLCI